MSRHEGKDKVVVAVGALNRAEADFVARSLFADGIDVQVTQNPKGLSNPWGVSLSKSPLQEEVVPLIQRIATQLGHRLDCSINFVLSESRMEAYLADAKAGLEDLTV